MRDRITYRIFVATALAMVFTVGSAGTSDALSTLELKCSSKLGKAAAKIAKTASNEISKCRDADINGKLIGACPNADNTDKITSTAAKMTGKAVQFCQSLCSVSSTPCITNATCPPLPGGAQESCTAGAAFDPFDMTNINFPGPLCEGILGSPVDAPEQIGECTDAVTQLAINNLIDAVYGSITNGAVSDSGAQKCLSGMAKATRKLTATTVKQVAKCRDLIAKGKLSGDPAECATSDPKASAKIQKIADKLRKIVQSKCEVGHLAQLDICLAGVGGIATLTEAEDCLIDAGQQVGDTTLPVAARAYSALTVIGGAYPAVAACGDGIANQLPSSTLILGEECDGDDDAACPGECLPPGDIFECTCGDRLRLRTFASASFNDPRTDSDAGWTGNSHDQTVSDLSGMIVDMTDCDCDAFTDADCTGVTGDSVCTVTGSQIPRCSWDVAGTTTRCDDRGNDTETPPFPEEDEDEDCFICDDFSANAGAFCEDPSDCSSQCYDAGGTPTGGLCTQQTDCGVGEVCRGLCDTGQTCVNTPNGAPLPVSAAGAAICSTNAFRSSLSGTRNIVTGEHAIFFQLFSKQHLGETTERPCPVCGGFCVGGANDTRICQGRCDISADSCRFDTDCPGGEVCERDSPDCPGGFCQLDLICGSTDHADIKDNPCQIEYTHPFFGSMSNDCVPSPLKNITGRGFEVDHTPTTSETLTVPFALPCDSPFHLLDCPCPSGGGLGQPTRPNGCAPACDAGPDFGIACADGVGDGEATLCAGGANVGQICDEDGDCPGSTCSDNPMHCTGDVAFERFSCNSDLDCGTGTCVDACPGGRCTLLCLPDAIDPEEGVCAAATPVYLCENSSFISCLQTNAEGTCEATCSISSGACFSDADCPGGESCEGTCSIAGNCEAGGDGVLGTGDDRVGAGNCVVAPRSCIQDPIVIEGGDTLNGKGSPTDNYRVSFWCFGASLNPAVNFTSGFGGPGVLREAGVNVLNRSSTP